MCPRPITVNVGIFIIIVHVKSALRAITQIEYISMHTFYLNGEQTN